MKLHHLFRDQTLPIDQETAWAFFSNPANQLQLAPPWANLADASFDKAKAIAPGLVQVYRVRLPVGFSGEWVAEFKHIDAPRSFVKEQKRGPFAIWHHRHELHPVAGGVEIRDSLYYALPWGVLGEWLHHWTVRDRLQRMFDYRAQMLDEFFGAN